MKSLMLALLALTAVACADKVLVAEAPAPANAAEQPTAYGYLTKYGIPLGEKLRKAEEEFVQNQQRIVNGQPAQLGQIPWQAGLLISMQGMDGTGVCGGSLISATRVITAAHCWFDGLNQAWLFEVVLGSTLLFSGGTRIQTSAVAVHPSWFPLLVRNDVAIAYLPSQVVFSDTIAPVSLPTGSELLETYAGDIAIASGFGLTADNAGISTGQFLSHVSVNVITNLVCRLSFPLYIQDSNICTSGVSGGPCSGDSGGPLVVQRGDRNIMIGLTSFGSAAGCESSSPVVFARTSAFMDFIGQHM